MEEETDSHIGAASAVNVCNLALLSSTLWTYIYSPH